MPEGIEGAMKTYTVNTIENYRKWEEWFRDNGYSPWQYQYSWSDKEGFHTWFMKAGCEDIEVVTHSKEVWEEIMKFKTKK
jgi:hypothetical protein